MLTSPLARACNTAILSYDYTPFPLVGVAVTVLEVELGAAVDQHLDDLGVTLHGGLPVAGGPYQWRLAVLTLLVP